MSRPVYAHTTPSNGNPHAVVIEISAEDTARWQEAIDQEVGNHRPGKSNRGRWVEVTDLKTGDTLDLRAYPCGAGCRCAAQVRPHGSEAGD